MDGTLRQAPLGGGQNRTPSHRSRQRGVKRRLLTEGHGVPIGLVVESANRHDMPLVRSTRDRLVVTGPEPTAKHPQGMCLDKGDDDQEVRDILAEFGCTAHIRARGEEAQAITEQAGQRARRWVVESSHS
jgi:hypothetical protein